MCSHRLPRASADARPVGLAHIVAAHPEQGWYLMCDGTIVFDDSGELLPDGRAVDPHRVTVERLAVAA
ncbi:hypothetical protein B6E66_16450 [Streptomyces maremycinicus]|uniref:DUF5999 family protein n=1 Tax=Streptomyces maremycinicus TaxID=1679753 RepID=UPI000787CFE3|nr:DUF5999 family protein [Streptomyces sp. NBRC 110468]OQR62979.1 hypothetical protein B6E66_16450 [Streptomyces sp. B9173]